jgi:hypothetical protein
VGQINQRELSDLAPCIEVEATKVPVPFSLI